MELKDYTTDELRAELKRRNIEARRQGSLGRSQKAVYAYANGVVTYVSDDPFSRRQFKVKICEPDCDKYQLSVLYRIGSYAHILRANFTKDTAPRLGDIVRVRSRKTNSRPNGFGVFPTPYIIEVIHRAKG